MSFVKKNLSVGVCMTLWAAAAAVSLSGCNSTSAESSHAAYVPGQAGRGLVPAPPPYVREPEPPEPYVPPVPPTAATLAPREPQPTTHRVVIPGQDGRGLVTKEIKAPVDDAAVKIRDEGLNHSQVMDTLDVLCNVIGPRLTASPNAKRANQWTRDQLEKWGMTNAHLEPWGPFGRGWEVRKYSLQMVEPVQSTLISYPKAWSPGIAGDALLSDAVYLDALSQADLERYKGKLKGKVVLIGAVRNTEAHFTAPGTRLTDDELERLEQSRGRDSAMLGQPQRRQETASERAAQAAAANPAIEAAMRRRAREARDADARESATRPATTRPATPASQPGGPGRRGANIGFTLQSFAFAAQEGAALILTPSTQGDGGTMYVQNASIPGQGFGAGGTRVWSPDVPAIPPQVTVAVEDFNRLARMIQKGQTPRLEAQLQVQFHDEDQFGYNTVAEIQGSDLKDQVVMVGAHLDSWHSGTGATDNGVGSACAMEAIRIIKASGLKPRRTIRVALWTGEEEGLYGSAAYVKQHLGYDANPRPRGFGFGGATSRPAPSIVKGEDFERVSVYYNLDNGTGKIRGIYAQGNALAVPYFRKWLVPFADLGAQTVTLSNTGSTDHISFDDVGVPGFQFIQDPIEYGTRTHHSNQDVYDRLQADDAKQASTIMAYFLYRSAMMDDRFPRK